VGVWEGWATIECTSMGVVVVVTTTTAYEYLYSHRVFGIRLLQKCRPVCQYYEKYQMYDGANIKGGKQPMVTG